MAKQNFLDSTRRSVAQIKQHWDKQELELAPPFQRNPVWSPKQKSYLIDTILHGYPIPEIYVQETVSAKGELRFVIVDGQQRIRSCLEFVEGKYPLSDPEDSPWLDKTFDELTPKERSQIFGYNFMVRQLPDAPETQLVDIFKRINRNTVSLNKQELRHATYWGQFIESMEVISSDPLWGELNLFSSNDIRRMLDVEFVSEIAIALLHGHQNKKTALDKYYVLYEDEYDARRDVESIFRTVLSEIHGIFGVYPIGRWRKKSDFYSLFVVLAESVKGMPFNQNRRDATGSKLEKFGRFVDEYVRAERKKYPRQVPKYAGAVERAASDLANRRSRHNALADYLRTAK